MPWCPAVLAWLHFWKCKASMCKSTYYRSFTRMKQPRTYLHHDLQQSMRNSYRADTDHSNGQHRDHYSKWRHGATFQASGPHTIHRICSYACAKYFWLFKKCKGGIGTKINFLSRKQPVGKSVKQIIKLERPKVTNICHQETQFLAYELLIIQEIIFWWL